MRLAACALVAVIAGLGEELRLAESVVSDVERGLGVPDSREFRPGERVFLAFKIAGFQKTSEAGRMYLEYTIEPVDCLGIAFEPASTARLIAPTLRSETRLLTYSFQIPPAPFPGEASFRITVQDRIGNAVYRTELPFFVASDFPDLRDEFTVAGFRYFSSEYSDQPMKEPVFRPGETVWGRFYVSGFQWSENNRYKLSYGISLRNSAGKVVFTEAQAVSESRESFYPKWHVPALISVRLESAIRPGNYAIVIDARDETGGKTTKAEFPIRVR